MKPFEYYNKTTNSYPQKKDYMKHYLYDNGKCIFENYHEQYHQAEKMQVFSKHPNAVKQTILDKVNYDAAIAAYTEELNSSIREFKKDLFAEFGVSNNPKAELCYSLAYDRGHSSGFSEIYNEFSDLVKLIQ